MALSFQPLRDQGSEISLRIRKPESVPCNPAPVQGLPPGGTWLLPTCHALLDVSSSMQRSPWARLGGPAFPQGCYTEAPATSTLPGVSPPSLELATRKPSHERGQRCGAAAQIAFGGFCCWANCEGRQVAGPKEQGSSRPEHCPPRPPSPHCICTRSPGHLFPANSSCPFTVGAP